MTAEKIYPDNYAALCPLANIGFKSGIRKYGLFRHTVLINMSRQGSGVRAAFGGENGMAVTTSRNEAQNLIQQVCKNCQFRDASEQNILQLDGTCIPSNATTATDITKGQAVIQARVRIRPK